MGGASPRELMKSFETLVLEQRSEGEFIMPGSGVPVSEAAMQFFVEAMRANTSVLENVNKTMQGMQEEQKELLNKLHDVRERVIRIEALPRVEKELGILREKVARLELKDATDEGRSATWGWIAKNMPSIAAIFVSVVAAIFVTMVATGRFQAQVVQQSPADLQQFMEKR
jgi:hypothetical protein